jgi:hypothetical protein
MNTCGEIKKTRKPEGQKAGCPVLWNAEVVVLWVVDIE